MQFLAQKSSKKESNLDQNSNVGLVPKRLFGTLGVLIDSSQMPIGPNRRLGPRASGLG